MTEMNDRNDMQGNQMIDSPEIQPHNGRWNVKVRTFVVPLFFMLLHMAALYLMLLARVSLYLMSVDPAQADLLRQSLLDPAKYAEFMIDIHGQTFASLFAMLILIPAYLSYVYLRRKKGFRVLHRDRLYSTQALSSLAIIIGAMGLTQIWMVFLGQLDPASSLGMQFQKYIELMKVFAPSKGIMFALEVLTTVILIPIGEELLFRGIIQDEFDRAFPPAVSILATSLLFAVFHGNLIQASYVFVVGFALSLTYYLTKNILIPIGMHMVYNLIGSGVFSRLVGLSQQGEVILIFVLYAAIPFMIAGFILLFRAKRQRLATNIPEGRF